jgi:hypothetical protein
MSCFPKQLIHLRIRISDSSEFYQYDRSQPEFEAHIKDKTSLFLPRSFTLPAYYLFCFELSALSFEPLKTRAICGIASNLKK